MEKMSNQEWTPENLKKQLNRDHSDSELIKMGSEYVMDEGATEPRLNLSDGAYTKVNEDAKYDSAKIEKIQKEKGDLSQMIWDKVFELAKKNNPQINEWNLKRFQELFKNKYASRRNDEGIELSFGKIRPCCEDKNCHVIKVLMNDRNMDTDKYASTPIGFEQSKNYNRDAIVEEIVRELAKLV
jgi:hypothetical protein